MEKEGLSSEELVGLSNNDATHIAKGKRTKRLRLLSPCGVAATVITSSCSSASGDHGVDEYGSFSSSTTTDQEEEDMAKCLILLARGGGDSHPHHHQEHRVDDHDHGDGSKMVKGSNSINNNGSRKISEIATVTATTVNKVGFYIYECKTCNRTFPSFQALGGHRASHKRPKIMVEEKKPPPPPSPPQPSLPQVVANFDHHFEESNIKSGPQISLQLGQKAFNGTNKAKIHECSICGSEFTSGQALGGHMRRHRASSTTTTAVVQPRNILELDLNLPAPEEDLREIKFQFTSTQKPMVLSAAPALVDCHY